MNILASGSCLLLAACIPLGMHRLLTRLLENRTDRWALNPGLSLAAFLLITHAAGLATRSFISGLIIASLTGGAIGGIAFFGLRPARAQGPAPLAPPSPGPGAGLRFALFTATSALFFSVLVWPLNWGYDQQQITGHLSTAAQIQNDVYPPRFLQFPFFEFRYHYGFNTLTAAVCTLTGLRVDTAIALLVVACGSYLSVLLWRVGDQLFGPKGRLVLPTLFFLAGGSQPIQAVFSANWSPGLLAEVRQGGGGLVLHHFFQPPFMLGFVFLTCIAVLLLARPRGRMLPIHVVTAWILVLLSICHIVLFAGALIAVFCHMAQVPLKSRDWTRLGLVALCILGIVFVASRLHGFFAPAFGPGPALLPNLGAERLRQMLGDFGAWFGPLYPIIGLAGMWFVPRLRAFVLPLLGFNLAIFFAFRYPHSWDIVKFAGVASAAMSFGACAVITRLFASPARPRRWLGGLLLFACCFSSLGLLTAQLIRGGWSSQIETPDGDRQQAIDWMRTSIAPGEIVLGGPELSADISRWGGLSSGWDDYGELYGLPRDILARRAALLQALPLELEPYRQEGFRWVIDDGLSLDPLDLRIGEWLKTKAITLAYAHGSISVYRIAAVGPRGAPQIPAPER